MKPWPLKLLHLVTFSCAIVSILAAAGCGANPGNHTLSGAVVKMLPPYPLRSDPPPADSRPPVIRHVIVIFQENRTPDNLFHGLRGADIADSGVDSHGQTIPLTPVALNVHYDLDHSHNAFLETYDKGKMDGADKSSVRCSKHAPNCPPPNPQFVYTRSSDVQPYLDLAQTYTFADRMFQTNQGPSMPAHQFIISGTSAPTATSDLFAAENPFWATGPPPNTNFNHSGCSADPRMFVLLIDPAGFENQSQFPCFEHLTLPDLLDARHIGWRYYSIGDILNELWNGPASIRHLRFGPDWSNVTSQKAQVLVDIATGDLPAVSWVIPDGQYSDHAGLNDGSGPSWVAAIVNAVGQSQYWSDTVIFVTWDDWGGFYDHVAPPIYNSYEYGFRVPLIIVSPYVKSHYVSHYFHNFGSILKFVEENFELPTLGYADYRSDDFADCFDFSQAPLRFQTVAAPLGAEHFLKDTSPATAPDDD